MSDPELTFHYTHSCPTPDVYDRKRLTQPDRTPPPLMLSRSLWPGRDGGTSCLDYCKALPAIAELMFLNLNETYARYSRAADEARREREAQGVYSCCRSGWYHANCCRKNNRRSGARTGEEEDFFADEDGYTFYRGYGADYDAVYRESDAASDTAEGPPLQLTRTNGIRDLFPEDDLRPSNFRPAARPEDPRRLLVDAMSSLEIESAEAGFKGNAESMEHAYIAAGEESAESLSHANERVTHRGEDVRAESPAAAGGDAPRSTEPEAHGEAPGEAHPSMPLLPRRGASAERISSDNNGSAAGTAENEALAYPYRIQHLFLPPGFHTWGNVLKFLKYFFFVPAIIQLFHRIPTPSLSAGRTQGRRRNPVPVENPGKDLTEGEQELLRCAGLDTYLLVRFARFGFDVTFYPFLAACACVLPIYHACNRGDPDATAAGGYFGLTIDAVRSNDKRMFWILACHFLLYLYILRRLWCEWELFIKLRHTFLSKGDNSFHNSPTYQRIFTNTAMVESVPPTHRSDRNLREVFQSLFPGQIVHAEMLIDTSTLEGLLDRRRNAIDKYNTLLARHRYERWRFATSRKEGKLVGCCGCGVAEPAKPKIWTVCGLDFGQKDAFAHYKKTIMGIDKLVDEEYCKMVEQRLKWRDSSFVEEEDTEPANESIEVAARRLYSIFVPTVAREWLGEQSEFHYGTGFVQFKSTAAKQSAVQCNLSGQPYWMITNDAPDPRDLDWSNVGVSRNTLQHRKIIVQTFLLLGIFVWGTFIAFVKQLTEATLENTFSFLSVKFRQDYVPAFVVSIILLWIPHLFFLLARHVIHFKSHTECSEFVLMWNTGYRLANVYVTIFGISFVEGIQCSFTNLEAFAKATSNTALDQSAVLMNLVIIAAGQETMLQLLQWRSLLKQALFRPLVNRNARSKRYLEWLNEAPVLERSFIFGFYAPVLSYSLMISTLYAFMVPAMLAICAIFFLIATKVHTHNALFVYCQPFEGGGKIFYYWSRQVFFALYSSIVFFSMFLLLESFYTTGVTFLVLMSLITYFVDRSVTNTFVVNSLHLPISLARVNDEEEIAALAGLNVERDGQENSMYRHPALNQDNWNSKPTWK